jgi:hypothetical protein
MVLSQLKVLAGVALATAVSISGVPGAIALPTDGQVVSENTSAARNAGYEIEEGKVVSIIQNYWVRARLNNGEFVAVPMDSAIGEVDMSQGSTVFIKMMDGKAVAIAGSSDAFSQQIASSSSSSLEQRVRQARINLEQRQERAITPAPAPAPAARPAPAPAPVYSAPAPAPVRGLW